MSIDMAHLINDNRLLRNRHTKLYNSHMTIVSLISDTGFVFIVCFCFFFLLLFFFGSFGGFAAMGLGDWPSTITSYGILKNEVICSQSATALTGSISRLRGVYMLNWQRANRKYFQVAWCVHA